MAAGIDVLDKANTRLYLALKPLITGRKLGNIRQQHLRDIGPRIREMLCCALTSSICLLGAANSARMFFKRCQSFGQGRVRVVIRRVEPVVVHRRETVAGGKVKLSVFGYEERTSRLALTSACVA